MKNNNINKKINITDISSYLKELLNKIEELKNRTGYSFFCYRGEDCIHDPKESEKKFSEGIPNIFRSDNIKNLNTYTWFEKNILDEMKSNRMSDSDQYLEIAMDAQHGGFPSRLLDVSFNSLIALFFAVTPFYTNKDDAHDNVDGRVIIYASDKITTSNTESIIKIYTDIIRDSKHNSKLGSHFHMLIDFVDLNNRIKAQQGGFILFGGNQFIPIPKLKYETIIIPKKFKKTLRNQLKILFGIDMGMIYPEPNNKVDYLTKKATYIENDVDYYEIVKCEIELDVIYLVNEIKSQINIHCSKDNPALIKAIYDFGVYLHRISLTMRSRTDDISSSKLEELKVLFKNYLLDINSKLVILFGGNVINPTIFD